MHPERVGVCQEIKITNRIGGQLDMSGKIQGSLVLPTDITTY